MWPPEVLDVPEVFVPHLAFQTEAFGASGSEASEAPEAPELEAGSYLASHDEPELADSHSPPPST